MALKINKMKEKEKRGERTETSIRRTPQMQDRPAYRQALRLRDDF